MASAPVIHTTNEVCEFLGVSRELLSRLSEKGVIPKIGRGRWDLKAVTQAYVKHLQERAAGRRGEGTNDEPPLDLAQERAKLAQVQAEKHRLQIEQLAGRLIDRADVERVAFAAGKAERASWEAWPARIAPGLAAELGTAHGPLATALEREVRAHLADRAAEPPPQIGNRFPISDDPDDEGDDA